MDLYNVEDVAPNLGRLLEFQREDLLAYFVASEQQRRDQAPTRPPEYAAPGPDRSGPGS